MLKGTDTIAGGAHVITSRRPTSWWWRWCGQMDNDRFRQWSCWQPGELSNCKTSSSTTKLASWYRAHRLVPLATLKNEHFRVNFLFCIILIFCCKLYSVKWSGSRLLPKKPLCDPTTHPTQVLDTFLYFEAPTCIVGGGTPEASHLRVTGAPSFPIKCLKSFP